MTIKIFKIFFKKMLGVRKNAVSLHRQNKQVLNGSLR